MNRDFCDNSISQNMPKEAPFTHSLGNILQLLIVCDGFCNQFSIEMVSAYFSHHTCCPTAFMRHFLQDRTKARRKPQKQKEKGLKEVVHGRARRNCRFASSYVRAHAFRAKDVNENDDWLSLQAGHAPLYNNPCSSLVTPDLVSPCETMGVL